MSTSNNKAVAVIRCSTNQQDNSPEVQRTAIRAYAARRGLEVVEWFEEIGVSGGAKFEDRIGVQAALIALKQHGAKTLLFADRTRISRDTTVGVFIRVAAERLGAVIETADGLSRPDPAGDLLSGILDHVSQFERAQIRGRIKAALASKKARGERTGGIPYGFSCPDGKNLEPDPREAALVERVKAMRANGRSLRGITEDLEREHVLNRSGKAVWHKTQIVRILESKVQSC